MQDKIRWGIMGTGSIAGQFAEGLNEVPDATLVAVGSRSAKSADAFGRRFGPPRRYGNYEALVNDPEVDVIYVATPHSCHAGNTLLALSAGKPVLCEKPFAINAGETEQVIQFARERKLFVMEAMWTRCFPLMEKLRELLATNAIGEVRMLTADFGFRAEFLEEERLFNPAYGGGALLDVGVYPVSLASMIFGPPTQIASLAHLGPSGVDEQAAIVLSHAGGQLATLSTAIRTDTGHDACLFGTSGQIRIDSPWWRPTAMTLSRNNEEDDRMEFPLRGNGYQFEAGEVGRCLRAGQLESRVMPLDETLTIMKTLDQIRAQWGLKYPMEQASGRGHPPTGA